MRRSPLLLMICVLSLVTGVALLRVSAYVAPLPVPTAPVRTQGTANIDLVSRFYDAVNTALRTGDQTDLDELVANDLVEHPAQLGGTGGRAGLVQSITTLRAMAPGLRVVVDDLQATGADHVTARVHAVGGAQPHFLGQTFLPTVVGWPLLEEFRIEGNSEGNQIVERWRGEADSVLLEPLFRAPIDMPLSDGPFVQVVRTSYGPSSEVRVRPTSRFRLDLLESGSLSHVSETLSGNALARAPVESVGQVLGTRDWRFLRSNGPEPVTVLEITILPGPSSGWGAGSNIESGPLMVAGGRMTLAPGDSLTVPKLGVTTLVSVEAGNLSLTAGDERIWAVRPEVTRAMGSDRVWSMVIPPVRLSGDSQSEATDRSVIGTGQSALIAPGAVVYWHNQGETPMVAFVMTLIPEDDWVCLGSPACQALLR